jgi:hypothetical protein
MNYRKQKQKSKEKEREKRKRKEEDGALPVRHEWGVVAGAGRQEARASLGG